MIAFIFFFILEKVCLWRSRLKVKFTTRRWLWSAVWMLRQLQIEHPNIFRSVMAMAFARLFDFIHEAHRCHQAPSRVEYQWYGVSWNKSQAWRSKIGINKECGDRGIGPGDWGNREWGSGVQFRVGSDVGCHRNAGGRNAEFGLRIIL